ncbi:MAG: hypothetical protein ABJA78_18145 [Ferruginibacter sp.]
MKKIFLLLTVIITACSFQAGKKIKPIPVPTAIQQLIKKFKSEEMTNPPRSVYSYLYDGKTVYYVPAPCCDFFSDLYDSKGKIIGHPDGGFTGRGDGSAPDFSGKRKNEKLIWKDSRGK